MIKTLSAIYFALSAWIVEYFGLTENQAILFLILLGIAGFFALGFVGLTILAGLFWLLDEMLFDGSTAQKEERDKIEREEEKRKEEEEREAERVWMLTDQIMRSDEDIKLELEREIEEEVRNLEEEREKQKEKQSQEDEEEALDFLYTTKK